MIGVASVFCGGGGMSDSFVLEYINLFKIWIIA